MILDFIAYFLSSDYDLYILHTGSLFFLLPSNFP